ncbi:MAG TPA: phosphotransferase [Caulobacteraceae bacterium]
METEPDPPAEEPLFGGLEPGRVVRVGDTVRRPAGPWTPTVHALLRHVRSKGFPAPEPLGLDDKGREILGFLPGDASNHPWPPALIEVSGARQIGVLLRAYHDAVADFSPPLPAVWRHGPQAPAPGEIILHGDFGPHNLIWSGDMLTGVIDFELARPGRPVEDAGFAAIRAAQLRPDAMTREAGFEEVPDRRARLEAFAEGYGSSPAELLAQVRPVQEGELKRIVELGGAGIEPWATFLRLGLATQVETELRWLEDNVPRI